jgi:hypothetical protein
MSISGQIRDEFDYVTMLGRAVQDVHERRQHGEIAATIIDPAPQWPPTVTPPTGLPAGQGCPEATELDRLKWEIADLRGMLREQAAQHASDMHRLFTEIQHLRNVVNYLEHNQRPARTDWSWRDEYGNTYTATGSGTYQPIGTYRNPD